MDEHNFPPPPHPHPHVPPPIPFQRAAALLVGVPIVDPKKYNGWDGSAIGKAVRADIKGMENLLRTTHPAPLDRINITKILEEGEATTAKILEELKKAANNLRSGDLFIFFFRGHGGIFYTPNDHGKGFINTLCCYDGTLWDKELREIWKLFQPNVRIVMISGSCHSESNNALLLKGLTEDSESSAVSFMIPTDIPKVPKQRKLPGMTAMMIHFAACEDAELSYSSDTGSVFAQAFIKVLNNRIFNGNYEDLHRAILQETADANPKQIAQYNELGPYDTTAFQKFREQKPFTVNFPKEFTSSANVEVRHSPPFLALSPHQESHSPVAIKVENFQNDSPASSNHSTRNLK